MIELKPSDRIYLQKAYFPVAEKPIKYLEGLEWADTNDYKAIIKSDTGDLLNITTAKYKLIPNYDLIKECLDLLDKTDQKCYIDYSHSFISDKRMRLQFTFPELFLTDEEQNKSGHTTPISLFIHNSYDSTEGVRGMWGAIRGICSNGMIFGLVKDKIYARHTKNAEVKIFNFKESMGQVIKTLPDIQKRIDILHTEVFKEEDKKFIEDKFPKKLIKDMGINFDKEKTRWQLLNILTFWISHYVNQQRRYQYQQLVSKQFDL